jgi:cytochrome c oxidase subunit 2
MEPINELGNVSGSIFRSVLFWVIGAFVLIEALLLYVVFRFRKTKTNESAPRPQAHRGLEFAWTLAPAIILVFIGVPVVYQLFHTRDVPSRNPVQVEVVGHSWGLELHYPEEGVTATDRMHLPVGRQAHVTLTARGGFHSLRVPELGGKWDLIRGRSTHVWVTPREIGEYAVRCAESCAGPPAVMGLVVEQEEEFQAWLSAQSPASTDSSRFWSPLSVSR